MALTKIVNGVSVALSVSEEADLRSQWKKNELDKETDLKQNAYKHKRAIDYPAVVDQLDMLWHSMDLGEMPKAQEFYTSIKAVKDKYPKGESNV